MRRCEWVRCDVCGVLNARRRFVGRLWRGANDFYVDVGVGG